MSSDTDRHIRVPDHVHKEIMARKRGDETVGEAVERLIGGHDLVDFAYDTQPTAGDPEARVADLEASTKRKTLVRNLKQSVSERVRTREL